MKPSHTRLKGGTGCQEQPPTRTLVQQAQAWMMERRGTKENWPQARWACFPGGEEGVFMKPGAGSLAPVSVVGVGVKPPHLSWAREAGEEVQEVSMAEGSMLRI